MSIIAGRSRETDSDARPDVHGRIIASGAVMAAAAMVGAAANFALVALVGRGLGATQTGVFFTSMGVFMVLANASKLGADTGVVRFLARHLALDSPSLLRPTMRIAVIPVAIVGTAVGAVVALLRQPIAAALIPDAADGEKIIVLLGVSIPLFAVATVTAAEARAMGRVGVFAMLQNVLLPLGRLAGVGVALMLGAGLFGAFVGWAAVLPLLVVAGAWIAVSTARDLERRIKPVTTATPMSHQSLRRSFWGFSGPRAVTAIVETTFEWVDVIIVGALAGPKDAGVYAVASRSVKVILLADYATRVSLSTRISAAFAREERTKVRDLYSVGTTGLIIIALPVLITLALFNQPLMEIFGHEFRSGGDVLVVLSLGMMLVVAAGSIQSILLLGGRSADQLVNKFAALTTLVVGCVVLVPLFGAVGGAIAWCAASALDTILAVWRVRGRYRISLPMRAVVRPAGAAIVSLVPIGVITRYVAGDSLTSMIVASAIALVVYVSVLIGMGLVRELRSVIQSV